MRVGLVSCVKSKRAEPAPAGELYTSPLFAGARRAVEDSCDRWFILSARHGLLAPETVIGPYEETLTTASRRQRRRWSRQVLNQIHQTLGEVSGVSFEIHAGKDYYDFGLAEGLRRAGATVELPLENLPMGRRLAHYRRRDPDESRLEPSQGSRPGRRPRLSFPAAPSGKYLPLYRFLTHHRGETWEASFAEIEEVLGTALPASARRHPAWWANERGGSHSHARAWLAAGFETRHVRLDSGRVSFQRTAR